MYASILFSFFLQYPYFTFTCVHNCEPKELYCYQQVRGDKKSGSKYVGLVFFTFEDADCWSNKEKPLQRIPEIIAVYYFPQLHQKPSFFKPFIKLHLKYYFSKILKYWLYESVYDEPCKVYQIRII